MMANFLLLLSSVDKVVVGPCDLDKSNEFEINPSKYYNSREY